MKCRNAGRLGRNRLKMLVTADHRSAVRGSRLAQARVWDRGAESGSGDWGLRGWVWTDGECSDLKGSNDGGGSDRTKPSMTLRSGWLGARVAGSRPRRELSRIAGRRRSVMVEDGPVACRGSSEDGRQDRGTCGIPARAEPDCVLHCARGTMRLQQGCYGYVVVVRAGNPFSGPGGSWFWRATGGESLRRRAAVSEGSSTSRCVRRAGKL